MHTCINVWNIKRPTQTQRNRFTNKPFLVPMNTETDLQIMLFLSLNSDRKGKEMWDEQTFKLSIRFLQLLFEEPNRYKNIYTSMSLPVERGRIRGEVETRLCYLRKNQSSRRRSVNRYFSEYKTYSRGCPPKRMPRH